MDQFQKLAKELRKLERPKQAKALNRFFKTAPGEYGEGDQFLGLKTYETRSVALKYLDLPFPEIVSLLASKIHEERTAAVMILTRRFEKADLAGKKEIYNFYLKNLGGINNWDLVDCSAPLIVGGYLFLSKKPRRPLYDFARSKNLWKRRIGIMATFYFIREKDFNDALKMAEILLNDKEDLIHKAMGWMLREIGNRNLKIEEEFLKKYATRMPRTMLRYAIEKFPEAKRRYYLQKQTQ